MTEDQRGDFCGVLLDLASLFDAELSDTRLSLYFAALRDLPYDEFLRAVEEAARRCRFFPKPAELLDFVRLPAPDAGALLAALQAAMRKYGTTPGLNPHDQVPPLLNLLIERLGGWYTVMGTTWEALQYQVGKLAAPLIQAAIVRGIPLELEAGAAHPMRRLPEPHYDDATPEQITAANALVRGLFRPIK